MAPGRLVTLREFLEIAEQRGVRRLRLLTPVVDPQGRLIEPISYLQHGDAVQRIPEIDLDEPMSAVTIDRLCRVLRLRRQDFGLFVG